MHLYNVRPKGLAWRVAEGQARFIQGDQAFFEVTKAMHNALQGRKVSLSPAMLQHYRQVNLENARRFTREVDLSW